MANKKHFWKVVWFAVSLPIIFAVLDLIGAAMWRSLGGWSSEAYLIAMPMYMLLFWTFAYLVIVAIALTYWYVKRDKSETLALLVIPVILLQFGAEDVWFYLLGNHELLGVTMPWLTGNLWPLTIVSWVLGSPVVTGQTLIASVLIGHILVFYLARWLVGVKG